MDVTIDQAILHGALRLIGRIAQSKPLLPMLQNVLLEVTPGRLTLTASDLDVGATTSVAAAVISCGRIAVRARLLVDYVAALPGEPVRLHLEARESRLHATCGRFRASLPVADPDEFPTPPTHDDARVVDVDAAVLRSGLERVAFAAARDDRRPVLKGIHVRFGDEGLTLTACDGFRVARTRVAGTPDEGIEAIVPARAVAEFGRLLAGVQAARLAITAGKCMHLLAGDTVLYARLLEGQFPDVERVIPTAWRTRVRVETGALRRAAGMASLFWNSGGGQPLRVEVTHDAMRLHADGVDQGEAIAELAASVEGDEQTISLCTPYVVEILAAAGGEQLEVWLREPLLPVTFREVGRDECDLWLLMPMATVERAQPGSATGTDTAAATDEATAAPAARAA